MLDYGFEDIDGMDDDEEQGQNQPSTGRWTATSSYDVYMVDTPKETNNDDKEEQSQNPPFTGRWTATSTYDAYMVDTPKEDEGNGRKGPIKDKPSEAPPKHRRQR